MTKNISQILQYDNITDITLDCNGDYYCSLIIYTYKKISLKISKLSCSEVTYNNEIHIKDQINLLNQRQKSLKKDLIIILDLLQELENETDIQ